MDGPDEVIVLADEVDETGADVSVLSAGTDEELTLQVEERSQDVADIGPSPTSPDRKAASPTGAQMRPILGRDSSAPPPPPPKQPPPETPANRDDSGEGASLASESLSLAQLKNIVSSFQRMEPTAYAYTYTDTRTFAEEIEEWFQYTVEDRSMLRATRAGFDEYMVEFHDGSKSYQDWSTSPQSDRENVVTDLTKRLLSEDSTLSATALKALGYIALGAWAASAAAESEQSPEAGEEGDFEPPNDRFKNDIRHIHAIRESARLLCRCGALEPIWRTFQDSFSTDGEDKATHAPADKLKNESSPRQVSSDTVMGKGDIALTILYAALETGRWDSTHRRDFLVRDTFTRLEPSFLSNLCEQIARVRWDEHFTLQTTRSILLLWKGMLLTLGSSSDLEESKHVLGDPSTDANSTSQKVLTTTPLDYHLFRQEITSKYPAYNPPPELLPLEPDNTSLLPPLHRSSRSASQSSMNVTPAKFNKSIFEQPVHIATPVPSPPPSPAGPGGKVGKKQNYQTNQQFPFLYPPLDSNSNSLGGKGLLAEHDKLVGKKWEGGDVPASILEAGELFASRTRMSRPIRQLWEAREACIKYDRGWGAPFRDVSDESDSDGDVQAFDLDDQVGADYTMFKQRKTRKQKRTSPSPLQNLQESDDAEVQRRLDVTDKFYRGALPHLQSIIIVVLKLLLANMSATGGQPGSNQPSPAKPQFPSNRPVDETQLPYRNLNLAKQLSAASSGAPPPQDEGLAGSFESLNAMRTREITSKAISGMLLTMLKWFRFSHVLKFQYLTQLLLDSNYIPLALKYFAMQDIDRAVDRKLDDDRLGFFSFCREDLGGGQPSSTVVEGDKTGKAGDGGESEVTAALDELELSEDEAQPPAIIRRRRTSGTSPPNEMEATEEDEGEASPPGSPSATNTHQRRPEVDELGYPTTALPQQPLTTYSARFFFTTIAMLRILQKISKGHAHRALLLVQYKSSTILRRALKVPQPALRLYTLKLFKSQVPFCGRKWRQGNMRVITAIYVFCRMGLRDEWISGTGAVDEWVENALATEQAWRGLTGWWHSRFYRDAVGLGRRLNAKYTDSINIDEADYNDDEAGEETDFFARELERFGLAAAAAAAASATGADGASDQDLADEDGMAAAVAAAAAATGPGGSGGHGMADGLTQSSSSSAADWPENRTARHQDAW